MKALYPTPEQERWIAVSSRLHLRRDLPWIAQRAGDWIAPTMIARCAFFVLGVVAGSLTATVFELLHFPGALLAAGAAMLIGAEFLIRRKQLYHAGIEEALWAGGLLAVVFELMAPRANSGAGAATLIALALLMAGARLLNPLFTTLAAVSASVAIDLAGGHRLNGEPDMTIVPSLFCYLTGALALFAGRAEFRRPSHDQALDWLVVSMPLCGFFWLAAAQPSLGVSAAAWISCGAAALTLSIGLRRRAHAPLISCLVSAAGLAYELRNLTALPLKLKLVAGGSVALIVAMGLERFLRTPRRGITSKPVGEGNNALELLQLAGVALLSPKETPDPGAQFQGRGGNFSGGGADGSF